VSTTRPSAAATTGVPALAAMSMPLCGARGWSLNTRRFPNESERTPSTGARIASEAGGEGLNVAATFARCARSRS
jgi:hypothetical protein